MTYSAKISHSEVLLFSVLLTDFFFFVNNVIAVFVKLHLRIKYHLLVILLEINKYGQQMFGVMIH